MGVTNYKQPDLQSKAGCCALILSLLVSPLDLLCGKRTTQFFHKTLRFNAAQFTSILISQVKPWCETEDTYWTWGGCRKLREDCFWFSHRATAGKVHAFRCSADPGFFPPLAIAGDAAGVALAPFRSLCLSAFNLSMLGQYIWRMEM